ncbi:hypothetical protein CYMTET_10255, partial [Cymbomonas tetramitiformis]
AGRDGVWNFSQAMNKIDKASLGVGTSGVAASFLDLLTQLHQVKEYSAISPTEFRDSITAKASYFADDDQHDCQEFLRVLLDALHDDLNRVKVKPPHVEEKDDDDEPEEQKAARLWQKQLSHSDSPVTDLFCGQLKSNVRCHSCSTVFTCYDAFMDLSLPIPAASPKPMSSSFTSPFKSFSRGDSCTLEDCLRAFTTEEELCGDEQYYCRKCKSHQSATKWLQINRFPKVLVLHLKRFSWTGMWSRNKLTTPVEFPQYNLDMVDFGSKEAIQPPLYNLFAISHHMGGLGGGHYTASCLNEGDGYWYDYNDQFVKKAAQTVSTIEEEHITEDAELDNKEDEGSEEEEENSPPTADRVANYKEHRREQKRLCAQKYRKQLNSALFQEVVDLDDAYVASRLPITLEILKKTSSKHLIFVGLVLQCHFSPAVLLKSAEVFEREGKLP